MWVYRSARKYESPLSFRHIERLPWNFNPLLSGILRGEFHPSRSNSGRGRFVVMVRASRRGCADRRTAIGFTTALRRPGVRGPHERPGLDDGRRRRCTDLGGHNAARHRPSSLVGFRDAHAGCASPPRSDGEVGSVRFWTRCHGRIDVTGEEHLPGRHESRAARYGHFVSRGADAPEHGGREGADGSDETRGKCIVTDTRRAFAQSHARTQETSALALFNRQRVIAFVPVADGAGPASAPPLSPPDRIEVRPRSA
jgi:hypothetical protein